MANFPTCRVQRPHALPFALGARYEKCKRRDKLRSSGGMPGYHAPGTVSCICVCQSANCNSSFKTASACAAYPTEAGSEEWDSDQCAAFGPAGRVGR
eukprot:6175017-Pleurochrysis_carterae.AAC.6